MAYRVELTDRAWSDLQGIYARIEAIASSQAFEWFQRLTEAIYSLEEMPERGAATPEHGQLRQLLYGKKRHIYRLIYAIDESGHVVSVLHIRHGAQDVLAFDEAGR